MQHPVTSIVPSAISIAEEREFINVGDYRMLPKDTTDEQLISLWLNISDSKHTRGTYARHIERFRQFNQHKPLQKIMYPDLDAYHQWILDHGYAIKSHNLMMASVKSLLSWGTKMGYFMINVGAAFIIRRPGRGLSNKYLTENQVIKMLALEDHQRNHCVLKLLYVALIRVSELSNLKWEDCTSYEDGEGGNIRVIRKGGDEDILYIYPNTWAELMALPRITPYVFVGHPNGSPSENLQRGGVYGVVRAAGERIGVQGVSPHWLRHSGISHALDNGAPPQLVQKYAGHKSLDTTTGYAHIRPKRGLENTYMYEVGHDR